jgi:hypothetical protein
LKELIAVIPELTEQPFYDWLHVRASLREYEYSQVNLVLNLAFAHLAVSFGGYQCLWHEESERMFLYAGYMQVLSDINIKQIFTGVAYIKKGLSGYVDRPPRSPLQFLEVCKKASNSSFLFSRGEPVLALEESWSGCDPERAKEYIQQMRKFLNVSSTKRFSGSSDTKA